MTDADRQRWDAKYRQAGASREAEPPLWFVAAIAGLSPGRALDVACGRGQLAIWLAERGWRVTAVDISAVGLEDARRVAEARGVEVEWRIADLDDCDLGVEEYDLITVFRFLDRNTLPARLTAALRPEGTLVYETFSAEGLPHGHVRNPLFVLQPGELRELFPCLFVVIDEIVEFEAENVAKFVAKKPMRA